MESSPNDPRARAEELMEILKQIPMPLTVAKELAEMRNQNSMDVRGKIMCDTGILLFWLANEVNDLVIALTIPEEEEEDG